MINRLSVWKGVAAFHRFLFRIGLGRLLEGFILMLYVKGRRSGRIYEMTLMYDVIDGNYVVASARGLDADWLKNLQADPNAEVLVAGERVAVEAEIVSTLDRVVEFLYLRRKKRPRFVGAVMRLEGLPRNASHSDYEAYAAHRAVVTFRPQAGRDLSP